MSGKGLINQISSQLNRKCAVIYCSAKKVDGQYKTVVRQREAVKACKILGVKYIYFLNNCDIKYESANNISVSSQKISTICNEIWGLLTEKNFKSPYILISYDKNGGYGHPDHKFVNLIGNKIIEKHGVNVKLVEVTINRTLINNWLKKSELRLPAKSLPQLSYWSKTFGLSENEIKYYYPLSDKQLSLKKIALKAHKTQTAEDSFPLSLSEVDFKIVFGHEYIYIPLRNIEILIYPTKETAIDQPFGLDNTKHPIRKDFYTIFDNKHSGVDFPVAVGSKVYCSYSGVVVRREFHKGMGNVIGIRNGNIVFLYAHLDKFKVKLGQIVKQGELVALSGKSGAACPTAHLHFELRDITKSTLKEMIFEPKFNQKFKNHKDTFTYTVNNTNTEKSLASLSKLYFGIEKYWSLIRNNNLSLTNYKKFQTLPNATVVIIPNFVVEK